MSQTKGMGLEIFYGYCHVNGVAIKDIHQFKSYPANCIEGDYLYIKLSEMGFGEIRRSAISCYQVYYSSCQTYFSSRAIIASFAKNGHEKQPISSSFVRWVSTYAVAGNNSSLFENINCLMPNESITISSIGASIIRGSFKQYYCKQYQQAYKEDPKNYWDETFASLINSLSVLSLSNHEIDFPLSGGKDSRLLLALLIKYGHKDRIKRIYTNGSPVSPEVICAKRVCDILNTSHEAIDNSGSSQKVHINFRDKLPIHLFATEAEMSPVDLYGARNYKNVTAIHGQEGGLRNISGANTFTSKEALLKWMDIHLANGDKSGILTKECKQKNKSEYTNFINLCEENEIPFSDIPAFHRVWFRASRWVSRTWKNYNTTSFAPYIFMNHEIIKRTLSAGHTSRINEEFHFEMFKRLDVRLATLSFSGQSWTEEIKLKNADLTFEDPITWPEGTDIKSTKPVFEIIRSNWDAMSAYIESSPHLPKGIFDHQGLGSLNIESIHVANFQNLWQAFQCAFASNVMNYERLIDLSDISINQLPDLEFTSQ